MIQTSARQPKLWLGRSLTLDLQLQGLLRSPFLQLWVLYSSFPMLFLLGLSSKNGWVICTLYALSQQQS